MALSALYAVHGATPALGGVFFGLKAAVLALVFASIWRLGARALQAPQQKLIAVMAFVALFALRAPFPLVVAAAGVVGLVSARLRLNGATGARVEPEKDEPPDGLAARRALLAAVVLAALWVIPVASLGMALGFDNVFVRVALFFSKMAIVTFGGAYAALSYVAQQAVERFGWLAPGEMLDGLGMAETTPGPLILVLQFVGFMAAFRNPGALPPLAAGALGGLLATYVTFVPCFLWIFAGAPFVERLRGNRALAGALAAVAAAVVGVIANLALWFATHFLFRERWTPDFLPVDLPRLGSLDVPALALSILAGIALRLGLGFAPTLLASVGAGLMLTLL
jgi:chromate transporter